jgi:toxin YhaV
MDLGTANGWRLIGDQRFTEAFKDLESKALQEQAAGKFAFNSKLLARVIRVTTEVVPQGPNSPTFRLGKSLGDKYKSWCRAKFSQQYRIFFRYNSEYRLIIYSWFNDENTLRAYGSKTDAYKEFARMLENGKPPTDFDELIGYLGK